MSLRMQGVSREVGAQTHIYPVDLELRKGTMNVLLGPTLSGKTSLMRLMAGLDAPTSGRIYWEDRDVTGMRVQDRRVAMVYQQFINYPSMTVFENIASPLRLQRRSAAEINAAVHKAADMLRLTPLLGRRPAELSGGQQQRCALARALVKGAGLVLLDEPLANLDYKLREELRVEIPKIFEESGAIFVYATTEPEEALLLGGNTATLWEGRITQFDLTPRVYRLPGDAITARVFSDPPMNFLQVSKTGTELEFGDSQRIPVDGRLAELSDGRYTAGFRPNHLEIDKHADDAIRFGTTLVVTELTGSETFIHLDHHGERWVGLVHGVHNIKPGTDLPVYLDPAHIYMFDEVGQLAVPAAYATDA